jgi:kynurenine formamidase
MRGWIVVTRLLVLVLVLGLTGNTFDTSAQTREQGPWWPHPIWGSEDQSGGSNWITAAKILEAAKLVTHGKLYELGQMYEEGMPLFGTRTFTLRTPGVPSADASGSNRLVGNDEFVCAEIGQVGTQFDGPGHIAARMTMADGTEKDVYYNGFTGDDVDSPYGLRALGVENVKPIFTRGVLIDVAGYNNVDHLPSSYEVTLNDVRGALERQGMSEDDLRDGDAVLFRYGWSRFWNDHERYNTNPPGIGLEVARWVASRNASMVGSDQWTTEVVPNPDSSLAFPVHQELVTKNGVFNLENMVLEELARDRVYEFLFVFTPIRFKGATGSPGRPIAIR